MTTDHRHPRGAVRVRSNVVLAVDETAMRDAWDLVPGEIVEQFKPGVLNKAGASRRQRAENGYYLKCARCQRLAHEIGLAGCGDAACAQPPTDAAVAAARARHEDALRLIEYEREELLRTVETERTDLEPLVGAEDAVARFLGLEAVTAPSEPGPVETVPEPTPPTTSGVKGAVRASLESAAALTGRFAGSYCSTPTDNLVDTLMLGQARVALEQLAEGDGSELSGKAVGSPKFCAAHSSSALAVNSFAAWIGREAFLSLAGRAGFTEVRFEAKFPTGLKGNPPNLDVAATAVDRVIAIESKCTEYLQRHEASFQASYEGVIQELAHESWGDLFRELCESPACFQHLDVGQLVRHYLGLRRAIVDGHVPAATLLYLYWEPANAGAAQVFGDHRSDVERLGKRVTDPTVEFAAMSYRDLWAQWSAPGAPDWLRAHVEALRGRYDVELLMPAS